MDINVTSFFIAQFKEWWPTTKGFILEFYWWIIDNLSLIKFGVLIISGVLLVGLVIIYKKGKREFELFRNLTFKEVLGFTSKKPIKYLKQWERIENNLKSKNVDRMKIAVIEARHLFDRLLEESGYKGEDFGTKLKKFINISGFDKEENLLEVENLAKNLEKNSQQGIDYNDASEIIKIYKEAIGKELIIEVDQEK